MIFNFLRTRHDMTGKKLNCRKMRNSVFNNGAYSKPQCRGKRFISSRL